MALRGGPLRSSASAVTVPGWRPLDLMRLEMHFFEEGIVQGVGTTLAVSQHAAGANMSVDVAAGLALIQVTTTLLSPNDTHKTWLFNDDVIVVSVPTADLTNPRKDRIVADFDMTVDPNGVSSNSPRIRLIQGTPAGSPSAPAEPSNAITLAIIDVPASDTTISTGQITDSRTYVTMNSSVLAELSRQGLANNYATVGGTANAITLTLSPAPTTYAAPMVIWFKATADNTTAVTVNVNGLGNKSVKRLNGTTALIANDVKSGQQVCILYDGTNFQMLSPSANVPAAIIADFGDAALGSLTISADTAVDQTDCLRYSDVTINGTKTLTVSTQNKVLHIKTTGDVVINGAIDTSGMGGLGGVNNTPGASQGQDGTPGASILSGATTGGGTGGADTGKGGGGGASFSTDGDDGVTGGPGGISMTIANQILLTNLKALVACGSGGGAGGSASGNPAGPGGDGGAAVLIECGGNLTLGAASIINTSGTDGGDSPTGNRGGGGGGAPGNVWIVVGGVFIDNGCTWTHDPGTHGSGTGTGTDGGDAAVTNVYIFVLKTGEVFTH